MADRPYQRNAASPKQNKLLERLEDRRERDRRGAYLAVMATPEGRFVMWDLILAAGVFKPLWVPSAEIHERAGRHDFGLELMQRLQLTEPDLFQQMEREWWAREKRERQELNTATASPAADIGEKTDET